MHDSVDAREQLHTKYRQFVQNGIPQGQASIIAAFYQRKERVRLTFAREVAQSLDLALDVPRSLAEEETLNGAPTERVLQIRRVSYTTIPETPDA